MTVEAIVRHDTSQIRMSSEEHSEKIVDLSFVPIGSIKQVTDTGNRPSLICVCLDTNAGVVSYAQQVVDNLESLLFCRIIDASYVGDLCVFRCGVVLEECEDRYDAGWWDVDAELVLPDRELLNVLGHTCHEILAVLVEGILLVRNQVRRVHNWSMYYTNSVALSMLLSLSCDPPGSSISTNPHVCKVTTSRHLLRLPGGDSKGSGSIDSASARSSVCDADSRLDGQAACDGEAHGDRLLARELK